MIVGPRKWPSSEPLPRPSRISSPPAARPLSIHSRMRSRAAPEITGPTSVSGSEPSPITRASPFSASRRFSGSYASPTATQTELARQRWPAAWKAEERTPSTADSSSASGMTTTWFLAPPSAWTRLPCFAAVS